MEYVIPDTGNIYFNLESELYFPPAGNSCNFDLAVEGGGSPPIAYPIPPEFMVWSGHNITLTSGNPASDAWHSYNLTPAQHDVRDRLRFQAAEAMNDQAQQGWDKIPIKDDPNDATAHPWGAPAVRDPGAVGGGWDKVPVKDDIDGATQPWDQSIGPRDSRDSQGYIVPPFKDVIDTWGYDDTARYWEMPPAIVIDGYIAPAGDSAGFDLTDKPYIVPSPDGVSFNLVLVGVEQDQTVPTRPVDANVDTQGWDTNLPADVQYTHPWDTQARRGTEVDWDYEVQPNPPPKPPPDQPEIKEAYYYMNSSSLKKMPEGIPLEFSDLAIDLDIDSFSWSISCRILNTESMDLIKPGAGGPVEVEATVNGHVWRFMIEKYALDRKFPKVTYRVQGSSLTQLLAAPYSGKVSEQIETPTNALQVIQDLLELTAFKVEWDQSSLADYTIPAGVWGYEQKTPIEVIDELVKAAGGVIIPSMNDTILTAKHRYADGVPWIWPDITPLYLDFIIADSTISALSSQWQPGIAYNGVYVSGISDGVAVDVVKAGTAGDVRSADVYDALNLTTQQCRGRGVSILGQSGDQEIVTIEIPIPTSGAPGLIEPGKWGEVQDTRNVDNSWRGLVLSNSVRVSKPGAAKAVQIIQMERHHYA